MTLRSKPQVRIIQVAHAWSHRNKWRHIKLSHSGYNTWVWCMHVFADQSHTIAIKRKGEKQDRRTLRIHTLLPSRHSHREHPQHGSAEVSKFAVCCGNWTSFPTQTHERYLQFFSFSPNGSMRWRWVSVRSGHSGRGDWVQAEKRSSSYAKMLLCHNFITQSARQHVDEWNWQIRQ